MTLGKNKPLCRPVRSDYDLGTRLLNSDPQATILSKRNVLERLWPAHVSCYDGIAQQDLSGYHICIPDWRVGERDSLAHDGGAVCFDVGDAVLLWRQRVEAGPDRDETQFDDQPGSSALTASGGIEHACGGEAPITSNPHIELERLCLVRIGSIRRPVLVGAHNANRDGPEVTLYGVEGGLLQERGVDNRPRRDGPQVVELPDQGTATQPGIFGSPVTPPGAVSIVQRL